ncbi:hypothetical protein KHA80_14975 [Anaerobacillus sp. HL2]|nr:hypothetical protein KHA80_14975 [Anaerobacillus sp. HL2]
MERCTSINAINFTYDDWLYFGMIIAIIFEALAGKYSMIYEAFRPILSLILGIPPIILVVLAMVWFGTGPMIPIVVVGVLVFPTFSKYS